MGDGRTINAWYDTWLQQSLRKQIYGPLPQNEEHRKVNSLKRISPHMKSWNLTDLPFTLPPNIKFQILSEPLPQLNDTRKDNISWKLNKDENFTSKSAYNFILTQELENHNMNPRMKNKT